MAKNKIDYNNMPLDMNFRQNLQSGSSMRPEPARQDSTVATSATRGVKQKVYQQKQQVASDARTANARKAAEEGKLKFYYNNNDSLTPEAVKVGLERGLLVNDGGQLYRMEKDTNGNLIRNTLPIANYSEDGNVVPKAYSDLGSGQSFDAKSRMTLEQIRQNEAMQNAEAQRGRAMGATRGMGAIGNSGSAFDNAYAGGLVNSAISTVHNIGNILGGGQNEYAGLSDYSQDTGDNTVKLARQLGNANGEVAKTLAIPAAGEVALMKGAGQVASAVPKFAKLIKTSAHVIAPALADAGYESTNSLSLANTGRITADEAAHGVQHEGMLGIAKGLSHVLPLPNIVRHGVQAYADGAAVLHRAGPRHGGGHGAEEPSATENRISAPGILSQNVMPLSGYINNPYATQPKHLPFIMRPQQVKGV